MVAATSSDPIREHPVFSDLLDLLKTIPLPDCSAVEADPPVSLCSCDSCRETDLVHKLKGDVIYIQDSLQSLRKFEQNLANGLEPLRSRVNEPGFLSEPRFKKVISAVTQLKFKLPYKSFDEFGEIDDPPVPSQEDPSSHHAGDSELGSNYNALNDKEKKCLWCFSVFRENEEVKKRVVINWWIGDGLLEDPTTGAKKSGREKGEDMLRNLESKRLIEQVVEKKRKLNKWRMPAAVRSIIKSRKEEQQVLENLILTENSNLDVDRSKVKTVFNVDRTEITERDAGVVGDLNNLVVLHLGKCHVRGLKLITKSVKKKKQLRLISLAGILSLKELPSSVCHLKTTLRVLDLSECQALERLPPGIGSLKSLAYLDISECHILFQMPKALRSLSGLEVLKGFVIGPTNIAGCSLQDLRLLKSLRELSLCVLKMDFPTTQDIADLAHINELVSLKIQWKPAGAYTLLKPHADLPLAEHLVRCCMARDRVQGGEEEATLGHVMFKLEKLDLRFPPKDSAIFLLVPTNFPRLKKLYIRGSDFCQLQSSNDHNHDTAVWDKVEILRLISLPKLSQIHWDHLMKLFPHLSYLELQNCPTLQISQPSLDQGVWTNQQC